MGSIAENITTKIPAWIGFLALIIIGAVMTVIGIVLSPPTAKLGFIDFGLGALVVGTFSWVVGATSKIEGRVGTVGVKVSISQMPWWAWVVDIALVAIVIVIFLMLN